MKTHEDNFYKRLSKLRVFVKPDIVDKFLIPIFTGIIAFGLFYIIITLIKSKVGS